MDTFYIISIFWFLGLNANVCYSFRFSASVARSKGNVFCFRLTDGLNGLL